MALPRRRPAALTATCTTLLLLLGGTPSCEGQQPVVVVCAGVDPNIQGIHNMMDLGTGVKGTAVPQACDGTPDGQPCRHDCDHGFAGGSVVCRVVGPGGNTTTTWAVAACEPDMDHLRGCEKVAGGLLASTLALFAWSLWQVVSGRRAQRKQAIANFVKRTFDALDRDHDGQISRDELASAAKAQTGLVPPAELIDNILQEMDTDKTGTISDKEFLDSFRMTEFMKHQRSFETFCSVAGCKPPVPAARFRKVGQVDVGTSSWEFGQGTGFCPCFVITDMARTASIAAIRSGFSRAFTCAIATGIMSQARIFTRLAAFRETLEEIGSSDMLSSADVDYMMDGGFLYLTIDSLVENAWATFSKLLFLPVFLLVYYLNNEIAQWRKLGGMMSAVQAAIENCGLLVSSAAEFDSDSDTAELMFKFFRHLNLVHVLQYRGLDPRLKLECGDKLQGLVSTGLLQGDNRAKLVAAGLKDRTLGMAWVMADAIELIEAGVIKGPPAGALINNVVALRAAMASMHTEMLNRPPVTMVGMMRIFVDGLLMLGIVGFAWALNSLGATKPDELALLGEDACGFRYYVWPMLAVFILAMFFTTMFIIAFTIQDPLGDDLDDYDVDALLLSTESSLYTLIRSRMHGTPEHDYDPGMSATLGDATESTETPSGLAFKGWSVSNTGKASKTTTVNTTTANPIMPRENKGDDGVST